MSKNTTQPLDDGASEAKRKMAELTSAVVGQWEWIDALKPAPVGSPSPLRDVVTAARQAVTRAASLATTAADHSHLAIDRAMEPSDASRRLWDALHDVRRRHPALLVGAISAASLLPGLRHMGTSRLTAARLIVRNTVCSSVAGCVLLYPEFVMRTAPWVARKADALGQKADALLTDAARGGG